MSEVSLTAEVIITQKMSQSNGLFNQVMRVIVLSTEVINVQTMERKVIPTLNIKIYLHTLDSNIQYYMIKCPLDTVAVSIRQAEESQ